MKQFTQGVQCHSRQAPLRSRVGMLANPVQSHDPNPVPGTCLRRSWMLANSGPSTYPVSGAPTRCLAPLRPRNSLRKRPSENHWSEESDLSDHLHDGNKVLRLNAMRFQYHFLTFSLRRPKLWLIDFVHSSVQQCWVLRC